MFANKSEVLYKCIANRKGSRFGGFLFILFFENSFHGTSSNNKLESISNSLFLYLWNNF